MRVSNALLCFGDDKSRLQPLGISFDIENTADYVERI